MLWAREWNARVERTWEKVWAQRRSKAPLLGRARGGGSDHHRNLPVHTGTPALRGQDTSGTGYGWREATCLTTGDWVLLVPATGGWAPLEWAKGSWGLRATRSLLHGPQEESYNPTY